jgi:hypothetical protein
MRRIRKPGRARPLPPPPARPLSRDVQIRSNQRVRRTARTVHTHTCVDIQPKRTRDRTQLAARRHAARVPHLRAVKVDGEGRARLRLRL